MSSPVSRTEMRSPRIKTAPQEVHAALNEDGDSQGKIKAQDWRTRTSLLLLSFVVGIAFGIVVSQRLYIESNRPEGLPSSTRRALTTQDNLSEHKVLAKAPTTRLICTQVDGDCELEAFLRKTAPQKEILVAISNYALVADGGKLPMWISCIQRLQMSNYMVLAIDEELHAHLDKTGVPNYFMKTQTAEAQAGTGSNHAVSALKFGILAQFLKLGWNVLLSDVDVVTFDNPFSHLYRDRDIEGMSDGYDDPTSYGFIDGFDDPTMGWARYAQATKHFNLNSGLFYTRANENTLALMNKLADRLSKQKYWDQSAFNEEIFFLSHGDTSYIPISVRVLDYWKFMNSKILFKRWRHMAVKPQKLVMAHMNYHPDKAERMKAVMNYIYKGDATALMRFPGGSEPGS